MPPKPPQAILSMASTAVAGTAVIADPTPSKPSPGSQLKSGTIGWGDGDTTSWAGKPAKESHIYQVEGVFTPVLTVWDSKGMTGSTTASVTVTPPTPLPPDPPPVQPPVPAAPTNLIATPGDTTVNLTWSPSPFATTYTVKRGTVSGGPYVNIAGTNVTNLVDTGRTNGTTYFYVVTASNVSGTSPNSGQASATPVSAVPTAPNPPSNLQAGMAGSAVTLLWVDNATNETAFQLERKLSTTGSFSLLVSLAANTTTYLDSTVAANTAYQYRIRAMNGPTASAYSNTVSITTPATSPVTSPDGTNMPPATQIVDAGGSVWTFGAAGPNNSFAILRDGAQVGGAFGRQLRICGTIYLMGDDLIDTWYVLNAIGDGWTPLGAGIVPPCGNAVVDSGNYRPQFYGPGTQSRFAWASGAAPVVLRVINLNDTGAGSLRAALEDTRPRVVVFEVSGYIVLNSDLSIRNPYCVIAGQTAPSPGITIRMATGAPAGANIYVSTHDVLWQHVRIRPGDDSCNSALQSYSPTNADLYNIVYDHLTVSWAQDEGLNFDYYTHDSTIWRCLVSEVLIGVIPASGVCSAQGPEGGHGIGIGFGENIAGIQNLLAHNNERNFLTSAAGSTYYANNLIYNPGSGPSWADLSFAGEGSSATMRATAVNNYLKRGSFTEITIPGFSGYRLVPGAQLYLNGNIFDDGAEVPPFTPFFIGGGGIDPRVGTPPNAAPVGFSPLAASAAYSFVLANAGARPLDRDSVDTRIVTEVQNRTGSMQTAHIPAPGYPALAQNTRGLTPPVNPNAVAPGQTFRTNLEVWLESDPVAGAQRLEPGAPPSTTTFVHTGQDLQAAIDAAHYGDTLILDAGATFQTPFGYSFLLRNKGASNGTDAAYITITTSNPAGLPPPGTRVVANLHAATMPKIRGNGGAPAITTEPYAQYYKLVGLDISTQGDISTYTADVVDIGLNGSAPGGYATRDEALNLHHITIDRCFIHPAEITGSQLRPLVDYRTAGRGIGLQGHHLSVINCDIRGFGGYYYGTTTVIDAYGIYLPKPPSDVILIENNYIEATSINFFTGGSASSTGNTATVAPGATATQATFSQVGNLQIGDYVAFEVDPFVNAVNGFTQAYKSAIVSNIAGTVVTYAGSGITGLNVPPHAPGRAQWRGDHITNLTYRRNTSMKLNVAGGRKGHFELKDCVGALVESNLFDGEWPSDITCEIHNQDATAPWTTCQNITFRRNKFANFSRILSLNLQDSEATSQPGRNILFEQNLGIGALTDPTATHSIIANGGDTVTIRHNTIIDDHADVFWFMSNIAITNVVLRDNIGHAGQYGYLNCQISPFTPVACWPGITRDHNVILNQTGNSDAAMLAQFPADTFVPTTAAIGFVDAANGNYALAVTSPYHNAASDGVDIGADIAVLNAGLP